MFVPPLKNAGSTTGKVDVRFERGQPEPLRQNFPDRKNHTSPNSALPEAAVAGALGIQLGGAAKYFGEKTDKPFIGKKDKDLERQDIEDTVNLMYASSVTGLVLGCLAYYFLF